MPTYEGDQTQPVAIGNAITRLHRERYGRGATTTRTVLSLNSDYIVVFLEDIYTTVERTLIDAGNQELVKETRKPSRWRWVRRSPRRRRRSPAAR
jgi:uncharacterized protein YbcI